MGKIGQHKPPVGRHSAQFQRQRSGTGADVEHQAGQWAGSRQPRGEMGNHPFLHGGVAVIIVRMA